MSLRPFGTIALLRIIASYYAQGAAWVKLVIGAISGNAAPAA